MSKRRREGAAPSTIRYELVLLGRMFSLAVKAQLLISRPPLPTIKVQNTRQGFFEDDEIARVLEHLPEYARPPIHFAAITGCRIGEIRLLQWCNVDFKEGVIHLAPATAKNEAERTWPFGMHAGLMTVILGQRESARAWQQKNDRPLPWVFHRDGRPLGNFGRSWETACKKAGCPGRVVHDLRRTAIRNLVRAGVTEGVAMQLTGHKTRFVFDRYDITVDADLGTAVKKLAASSQLCI
jgi:integrase